MIIMSHKKTESVRISKEILQLIRTVAKCNGKHIRTTIDNLLEEGIKPLLDNINDESEVEKEKRILKN